MSLDASRWAWMQPIKPASAKLVALALADRAGADDCAFPSYESLVCDTGLDRKTVARALAGLVGDAWIEDTGRRVGATRQIPVYRLLGVEHREQFQKRNGSNIGTVASENSPESGTVEGGNSTVFPDNSPKNGTRNLPENLNTNTKARSKRAPVLPEPPPGINLEAWREWVEYRAEKKKPVSAAAARKAWKRLAGQSDAVQAAIIEQSIANDWQGLFPLGGGYGGNGGNNRGADSSAAGRARAAAAAARAGANR